MSNETLQNRREILFAYEAKDSNPNGDPDMGNLPRMDDEGFNIVTDLRLKRTVRDYWDTVHHDEEGKRILVKQKLDEKGDVLSMEDLVLEELGLKKAKKGETRQVILDTLPSEYIDVRCFGAAVTVKGANVSITGPVQFNIGRSLNKPNVISYPLSSSLSSGEGKGAGTLGEFHVVDYSLILFHGLACEYSAKATNMSEEDFQELYNGLWWGTKMLNTRSKSQQVPRFLIAAVSAKEKFQIGDLWRHVDVDNKTGVKSIDDIVVDISNLVARLKEYKDDLKAIEVFTDGQTTFRVGSKESNDLESMLSETGIELQTLQL